jgi:hypothetical protein
VRCEWLSSELSYIVISPLKLCYVHYMITFWYITLKTLLYPTQSPLLQTHSATNLRRKPHADIFSLKIFPMAAPICAGLRTTVTPADSNALILSAAVPFPPEMIAPACPIRRPGGAVKPVHQWHN